MQLSCIMRKLAHSSASSAAAGSYPEGGGGSPNWPRHTRLPVPLQAAHDEEVRSETSPAPQFSHRASYRGGSFSSTLSPASSLATSAIRFSSSNPSIVVNRSHAALTASASSSTTGYHAKRPAGAGLQRPPKAFNTTPWPHLRRQPGVPTFTSGVARALTADSNRRAPRYSQLVETQMLHILRA